jgi:hypothetical protein
MRLYVAAALVIWLAIILALGSLGASVSPLGTVPLRIVIAVAAPLIVFLVTYSMSAPFRTFVLSSDIALATALQPWRFAGFTFLALYAQDVLPGVFSWPAGLGDMAIGITAPLALALVRQPHFATSRFFIVWNLLGILDLVIAVSIGAATTILATGAPGELTVAPMAQMPLVMIPAYFVPLFIMLHLTALFQARRVALSDRPSQTTPARSASFAVPFGGSESVNQ